MTDDHAAFAAIRTRPDYGMQIEVLVSLIYHFLVRSGDWVVDGGVAGAVHTLPLSRLVASTGKVLAFEASPRPSAWLREHLASVPNGACIEFHPRALGDRAATVEFIIDKTNTGLSHVRQPGEAVPDPARGDLVSVPMVTLDEMTAGGRPISFIKLDLEGYDFLALRGGEKMLLRDRPFVIFEDSGTMDAQEYLSFFEHIGYAVYDVHNSPITAMNWHGPNISFEAICGPRDSADLQKARALIAGFWATLAKRKMIGSWKETFDFCQNPFNYVLS